MNFDAMNGELDVEMMRKITYGITNKMQTWNEHKQHGITEFKIKV